MPKHGTDFERGNDDMFSAECDAHPQERISRLQYMIAFLMEENEQLRMQAAAKVAEERA